MKMNKNMEKIIQMMKEVKKKIGKYKNTSMSK